MNSDEQLETRDNLQNQQEEAIHVLKKPDTPSSENEESEPNCGSLPNTETIDSKDEGTSDNMDSLLQKEELGKGTNTVSDGLANNSSLEDIAETEMDVKKSIIESHDYEKQETVHVTEDINQGETTSEEGENETRNGNETQNEAETLKENETESDTQNENETDIQKNEVDIQNENETFVDSGHEPVDCGSNANRNENETLHNTDQYANEMSKDAINSAPETKTSDTTSDATSDATVSSPSSSHPSVSVEDDESVNQNEDRNENESVEDVTVRVVPQGNAIDPTNRNGKRVHFAEEVVKIHLPLSEKKSSSPSSPIATQGNTSEASLPSPTSPSRGTLPCVPQLSAQQLIDGILYQAQYLGSTPVMFGLNQKTVRMQQARDAVRLLKESQGDTQPRIDINLKISVQDLIIADRKTNIDLITHPLKTVSYVADIENSLVIMAHRNPPSSPGTSLKLNCHILETADPREVAMVIGQAFSTAYKEFLKSHGIKEESLEKFEYQHVLSSQTKSYLEINSLADDNQTKEISFAKHKGEILGLMVIDSGYGSAIPSCIVAHMSKGSAATKSGLVNVGDHILSINGTSLVGMPLKLTTDQIKKCRALTVVKMVTSACPPVTDVTIMRPDLKYQLGFSVKDGNVCSLWRGSIAERSGIRVGHRIIEINGTSVVGLPHEEIVHMLSTTVGDIHIRTMPLTMYKILTGQIIPEYY